MKFIAQLLSILLLLIALSPVAESKNDKAATACCADHCSQENNDSDSSSSDEDCDFCNPLFSCACYSVIIVQSHDYSLISKPYISLEIKSIYKDLTPLQLNIPFWQPPKVLA